MMWVKSLHRFATVHAGLLMQTNMKMGKSVVEHVELGHTRSNRDFCDLQKIVDRFKVHSSFDVGDARLSSLSSGFAAADSDEITCDKAKAVGQEAMLQMDNVAFPDII